MHKTMTSIALRIIARPLRFGLVGFCGMIINTALLWALVQAGVSTTLAATLATEAAILNNFLLNDRWTFHAAERKHSLGWRLLRFNGVSLGGLMISVTLLMALITYSGLGLLPANLVAIGSATAWNYLVNSRWTWRGATAGCG